MRGVRREPGGPGRGVLRKLRQLHHRRHQRGSVRDHPRYQVRSQAGAVLDAVDAGVDQPREHLFSEAVGRDFRAVRVCHRNGLGEVGVGETRHQIPGITRDPVADELHPAVPGLRLDGDLRGKIGGLDLVGVVPEIAGSPSDVSSAPDQMREVITLLDPPSIQGRTRVANQQRSPVAVLHRLSLGLGLGDRTVLIESDVAVRIDQPGHDPTLSAALRLGSRFVADRPVHHIDVAPLTIRQDWPGETKHAHTRTVSVSGSVDSGRGPARNDP